MGLKACGTLLTFLQCAAYGLSLTATPTILWSNKIFVDPGMNSFSEQYISDQFDFDDLNSVFDVHSKASPKNSTKKLRNVVQSIFGEKKPEVMLVWKYDNLRTDEVSDYAQNGKLSSLQPIIKSASTSIVLPNTYQDSTSVVGVLSNAVRYACHSSICAVKPAVLTNSKTDSIKVALGDSCDLKHMSGDIHELYDALESLNAFQNGVTDFVFLTHSHPTAAIDKGMKELAEHINISTKGNYLGWFTSTTDAIEDMVHAAAGKRKLLSYGASGEQLGANGYGKSDYIRATPNIITGIVTMVFIFFGLWVGISQMMALTTNDQFWPQSKAHLPLKGKIDD